MPFIKIDVLGFNDISIDREIGNKKCHASGRWDFRTEDNKSSKFILYELLDIRQELDTEKKISIMNPKIPRRNNGKIHQNAFLGYYENHWSYKDLVYIRYSRKLEGNLIYSDNVNIIVLSSTNQNIIVKFLEIVVCRKKILNKFTKSDIYIR